MTDRAGRPDEPDRARPNTRLSAWSIVSLFLPALAAPFIGVALWVMPTGPGVGPASGPAVAFVLLLCLAGALCCTLLGVITGCVGGFRSGGHRLAWTGSILNGVLGFLVIVVPIYLIYKSGW
jgi:hypothetical protein